MYRVAPATPAPGPSGSARAPCTRSRRPRARLGKTGGLDDFDSLMDELKDPALGVLDSTWVYPGHVDDITPLAGCQGQPLRMARSWLPDLIDASGCSWRHSLV